MAMIGVASLLGEERRCLQALKKAKATSDKTAVEKTEISDIAGLPIDRVELALQRLITRGKVEKTRENKYYTKCENKKYC
jgi:DNA-binding IclR family transcriptional regulator